MGGTPTGAEEKAAVRREGAARITPNKMPSPASSLFFWSVRKVLNAAALFISLAVVVQITLVAWETGAQKQVVSVVNKLTWTDCLSQHLCCIPLSSLCGRGEASLLDGNRDNSNWRSYHGGHALDDELFCTPAAFSIRRRLSKAY